eukprot:4434088-Pleurochrysis_carterae.AAC.1
MHMPVQPMQNHEHAGARYSAHDVARTVRCAPDSRGVTRTWSLPEDTAYTCSERNEAKSVMVVDDCGLARKARRASFGSRSIFCTTGAAGRCIGT